jgi:hypothetical protein
VFLNSPYYETPRKRDKIIKEKQNYKQSKQPLFFGGDGEMLCCLLYDGPHFGLRQNPVQTCPAPAPALEPFALSPRGYVPTPLGQSRGAAEKIKRETDVHLRQLAKQNACMSYFLFVFPWAFFAAFLGVSEVETFYQKEN